MVVGLELAQLQIGALLELGTTSASASIVDTDADETLLAEVLFEQGTTTSLADVPGILDLLAAWTAILIHDHGVLLGRVEIDGLQHPCVQLHAIGRRDGEQLWLAELIIA